MATSKPALQVSNIVTGVVIGMAGLLIGDYRGSQKAVSELSTQAKVMPDRRDRELDQLIARVSALEARCQ